MSSLIVIVLFGVIGISRCEYDRLSSKDTTTRTDTWGGICESGRSQSPIDLSPYAAVYGWNTPFYFGQYSTPFRNATVRNTGHSVQISVSTNEQKYTVSDGGLPGTYILDQIHFHWESEHTVNHGSYAMEMHIVSHSSRYRNYTEALAHKHGVSVIAVFFRLGEQPNEHLNVIMDSLLPVLQYPDKSWPLQPTLSPEALLPANRGRYYRYSGSLTTPACNEDVIWTVLTEPLPVSQWQVTLFQSMINEEGYRIVSNNRPVQPLNGRRLVYVAKDFWDAS